MGAAWVGKKERCPRIVQTDGAPMTPDGSYSPLDYLRTATHLYYRCVASLF